MNEQEMYWKPHYSYLFGDAVKSFVVISFENIFSHAQNGGKRKFPKKAVDKLLVECDGDQSQLKRRLATTEILSFYRFLQRRGLDNNKRAPQTNSILWLDHKLYYSN